MTVAELIERLGLLPPGLIVVTEFDGNDWEADEVRVVKTTVQRGPNVGDDAIIVDAVSIS